MIVSGRSARRGGEVVDRITDAGGRAHFVGAELDGSPQASQDLAARAAEALGGDVDVLVNNAGIFPGSTTATVDEAMFDDVYGVNVKAPFFLTAAIAPRMAARERGDHQPGVLGGAPGAPGDTGETDPAESMMRGTPAGTSGGPEAIARAAVYLASDEARFVYGTVIDVDGGRIGVAVIAA